MTTLPPPRYTHPMISPRTPVLVGVGQYVDRAGDPATGLGPSDMLAEAARRAIADSGAVDPAIDSIAVVRLFADSAPAYKPPFGGSSNYARSLANRLGANPRETLYGPVGGNTPQMMVNATARRIAAGEIEVALIAGCEPQKLQANALKSGVKLDWHEDLGEPAPFNADATRYATKHEMQHGIAAPVNIYPLFENALAHHYGRTPDAHRASFGAMMARFTQVAAANPYAMLPVARTAEELVTPTAENRVIAWPYTKYLVANVFVDQAAAVLMMSAAAADRLGVPEARRVYLHGAADVAEKILVSERVDYHSSPAIRAGAKAALAEANITLADIAHIDLYSCFPVAVEIAADMIGLAHDDPRDLTLTGGLPYFGGPGNNYSLHGIAEVVARCRAGPGGYGLVFANGGFLTKHSFGVYSTAPGAIGAHDPAPQAEVDALPSPAFTETPDGAGTLETFTVVHDKGTPAFAIVIGQDAGDRRFLAVGRDGLDRYMAGSVIGAALTVVAGQPVNSVTLD